MLALTKLAALRSTQVQSRKGLGMKSNMAAVTLFNRVLQFRTASSFKCAITRLPGCHFCSVDSKDVNQSEVNAQEILESVHPPGKKLDLVVSCLRVDRVIASGLGMGRRFAL